MSTINTKEPKLIIGLTGGFGTGKTTAAGFFKALGAKVIDADKIAHDLIGPARALSSRAKRGIYRESVYKRIISVFGETILDKNSAIDRGKLSEIVFSNQELLKRLNSIVHPWIIKIIQEEIAKSPSRLIVVDAPLLIESGLNKITGVLIVVKASRDKQIERIQKKFSLSKRSILRRIKCQAPLRDKLRLADFVIDNNGTAEKTKRQVKEIMRRLLWKS